MLFQISRVANANKCTNSEPAQTTPEPADWGREAREKKGPIAVKRGPERALLVVKGRIGWRNGRIRLRKGAHADENCMTKRQRNIIMVDVQEVDD